MMTSYVVYYNSIFYFVCYNYAVMVAVCICTASIMVISTVGTELLLSMIQHLAGLKMTSVLVHLPEYLKMIQVAADFPGIPVHVSKYMQSFIYVNTHSCMFHFVVIYGGFTDERS